MQIFKIRFQRFVMPIAWAVVLSGAGWGGTWAGEPVDFQKQVAPILSARCVSCHHKDKAKGKLDLTTIKSALAGGDGGPAFEPGHPEESDLIFRVKPETAGSKPDMPREGESLTKTEIEVLEQWIKEGAKWPESVVLQESSRADLSWWSLQKLADATVPTLPSGFPQAWNASPIDRFIADRLAKEQLKASEPADKRALLRRLYYDLTGLPPTPQEMQSFLEDQRPDAYSRRVDQLLASPRYGERWGRYWLDIVRFGESNGFERNVLIENAWPFRDYVIRSLNEDKPFGQLVREHLAGDVVAANDPDDMIGVSFLTIGPYDDVGNQDPVQAAQIRSNTIDDMIAATGSAFLGLTVGCARCHDHKFDPIKQADYYRLQSAFDGTRQGSRPIATQNQLEMRSRRLQPLEAKRNEINAKLAKLEKDFQDRVAKQLKEDPVQITKPVVNPQGIEEKLPDKPIKFVRLTILNNDRNPATANGTRIDELEIWSRDSNPKNLAIATSGTKIEGPARQPGDFAGAYAPTLMIDGKYGAAWVAAESPAVVTIELPKLENAEKIQFSSDRNKAISGKSPYNIGVGDYLLEISTDGKQWEKIADAARERPAPTPGHEAERRRRIGYNAEESAQMQSLRSELNLVEQKIAEVPNYPTAWMGSFSQPQADAHILLGGDPQRKGPVVVPGSLSYFSHIKEQLPEYQIDPKAPESERRKALAEWIASFDNPLTWRVIANRLWHLHFGTGLVDTPSDFGYMGGRPTHPELLDWLASRLIQSGGHLKPLHREIVMSQTYRQSSRADSNAIAKDAQSRLLWRYPPRRLDGEQIRDSMLYVSGKLDETRGGPGFRLFQYLQDNVATYVSLDDPGPETYRRAIYHQAPRAARVDYLSDFDCPDNAQSVPARATTTTPLQSMTMWNHRFSQRMAEALSVRSAIANGNEKERVVQLFQMVYQRQPSDIEIQEALEFVKKAGWTNLARVLLNSNEFLYIE